MSDDLEFGAGEDELVTLGEDELEEETIEETTELDPLAEDPFAPKKKEEEDMI